MNEPRKAIIHGNTPSKSNCYFIITLRGKNGKQHGSLAKSKALKKYEQDFYMQLPSFYRNKDIQGHFMLFIDVYYPSNRADLDNSLKVVLDCLQKAKAIRNDNKCVKIVAERYVDKINPRVEFELHELNTE